MSITWKVGIAALGLLAATGYAIAQMGPGDGPMQDHCQMMQKMMRSTCRAWATMA